jgi:hypothetical protein
VEFFKTLKGKITFATCTTIIVGGAGFMSDIQSILFDEPKNSVVIEQIKITPTELSIPYQELSNPKLAQKYIDKEIELDATYLGPWNLEQVYGITFPQNVITLNHRDASYISQSTPLGSSDLAIPDFALTVPTSISGEVLKIKSHSKIKIIGSVKSKTNQFGQNVIVLEALTVTPAG